jgi:hypothetical protein
MMIPLMIWLIMAARIIIFIAAVQANVAKVATIGIVRMAIVIHRRQHVQMQAGRRIIAAGRLRSIKVIR